MESAVEETAEAPETPEDAAAPKDTEGQEPEEKTAEGEGQEAEPAAPSADPEEKEDEKGSGGGENAVLRVIDPDGEEREIPTEEAAPYVEKGLMWDSFGDSYAKLQRLAASCDKDVSGLIDALVESNEKAEYNRILAECHQDEALAKQVHAYRKAEADRKYNEQVSAASQKREQAVSQKKEALTERLASEFVELSKEVPDFKEFKDVPRAVVDAAVGKGISLYDAYLRFERSEARRRQAEEGSAAAAAKNTAGSMASNIDAPNEVMEALMAGLSRALN